MAVKGITLDGTSLGLKDEEVRQSVSTLGSTVSGLSSTVSGLSSTVSGLSSDVDSLGDTVTDIQDDVGALEITAEGLETTVSGLTSTVNTLSGTVDGLGTTVSGLSSDVSSLGDAVDDIQDDVDTLETTVSGITDVSQRVSDVENDFYNYTRRSATTLHKSDFEEGTWSYHTKATNAKRLRIKELLYIDGIAKIYYTTPTLKIYFGILETASASAYTWTTGWLEASSDERTINIPYTGYLVIILESSDSSTITIDAYDCNISYAITEMTNHGMLVTTRLKNALLQLARSIPYIGDVDAEQIYSDLYDALYGPEYSWDFTTSFIDTVSGIEAIPGSSNNYDPPDMDENGVIFDSPCQVLDLGEVIRGKNQTIEIDVGEFDIDINLVDAAKNVRFIMIGDEPSSSNGLLIWRRTNSSAYYGWSMYKDQAWSDTGYGSLTERNVFANTTVKLTINDSGQVDLYINGVHQGQSTRVFNPGLTHLYIGNTGTAAQGANLYDVSILAVRIFGEVIA